MRKGNLVLFVFCAGSTAVFAQVPTPATPLGRVFAGGASGGLILGIAAAPAPCQARALRRSEEQLEILCRPVIDYHYHVSR